MSTQPEQGLIAPDSEVVEASRRLFLTRTLKTASLAVPAVALASSSVRAGGKSTTNKVTAAATSTLGAALPEYYGGQNRSFFHEILNNEATHLSFLTTVLGTNARPKPTFQNLQATSYQQFAQMAAMFCSTGAGAYEGSSPVIFSKVRLAAASQLAFVEAYQSGWLRSLTLESLVPNNTPFSPPLTPAQVVTLISPYLVSLNGGPPATYDLNNPSDFNDTMIFNFALVQEYLENEFYSINIPIFFP